MSSTSIGDLSHGFLTRQRNAVLKTQMARLTKELSTGRSADVTRQLSGSLGRLADVEHRHQMATAIKTATDEAALFTASMQSALDLTKTQLEDVGAAAALAQTSPGPILRNSASEMAKGALDSIVSALNTAVAGRALFAGTDVSGAALEGSETLIAAARAAVSGATDVATFPAALDLFFDAGGGFETAIYQGGTDDLAPFQLGDGQSVQLSLRADAPAFRDVFKQLLTIRLADDLSVTMSETSRNTLLTQAGASLLTDVDDVVRIQADLGYAQERIERASVRAAAELTSLDYARNELISVDPFDTASELENVQFQLETLYTVTARSSRLNLLNFLS